MESINVLEHQLAINHFEDILDKFNQVSEWVAKNFEDVEFSVEFNDDSRNPITPRFIIKTRLFTGSEMTPHDRLLKKSVFYITKEIFDDTILMKKWIDNIVPSFKQSITKEVNDWYNRHQAKFTI